MPSIPLLRLEDVMTPERLEEIKQLAEVRLRVGDVMAAFTLELVDEIKTAKEEKAAAIRLGDERLAVLWDMKQKEIQNLKAEIIRLRRHLGEIP